MVRQVYKKVSRAGADWHRVIAFRNLMMEHERSARIYIIMRMLKLEYGAAALRRASISCA